MLKLFVLLIIFSLLLTDHLTSAQGAKKTSIRCLSYCIIEKRKASKGENKNGQTDKSSTKRPAGTSPVPTSISL